MLLPLECFSPGLPGGPNTCGTGSIGVADPETLAWRYYVKLDPADIKKAMWAEVSPDGTLALDLLRTTTCSPTGPPTSAPQTLRPARPPIRPVRRLAGAVPPSGITGATFYQGRLFVAGQGAGAFQVWSIDVDDRREAARGRAHTSAASPRASTSSTRSAAFCTGRFSRSAAMPTFGIGGGALVHFVPAGTLRLRLRVSPRSVVAGVRRALRFRATFRAAGKDRPVAGARDQIRGTHRSHRRNARAKLIGAARAGPPHGAREQAGAEVRQGDRSRARPIVRAEAARSAAGSAVVCLGGCSASRRSSSPRRMMLLMLSVRAIRKIATSAHSEVEGGERDLLADAVGEHRRSWHATSRNA